MISVTNDFYRAFCLKLNQELYNKKYIDYRSYQYAMKKLIEKS